MVSGNAGVGAADFNARAGRDLHANDVVQRYGLIDGAQIVKAIGPQRADRQAKINLREGSNRDGH